MCEGRSTTSGFYDGQCTNDTPVLALDSRIVRLWMMRCIEDRRKGDMGDPGGCMMKLLTAATVNIAADNYPIQQQLEQAYGACMLAATLH